MDFVEKIQIFAHTTYLNCFVENVIAADEEKFVYKS